MEPHSNQNTSVVVCGRGGSFSDGNTTITVNWNYFNDGELVATNESVPYLGEALFKYDPAYLALYEDELAARQAEGFAVTTIERYVAGLERLNVAKPPMPPVLDGTWQPKDTKNVFYWMGSYFVLPFDQDNVVLSGVSRSRRNLLAAEALREMARRRGLDTSEADRRIHAGWRNQFFAETSDCMGWNPLWIEVQYGLDNPVLADANSTVAIQDLASALGIGPGDRWVDTWDQNMTRALPQYQRTGPALPLTLVNPGRTSSVLWEQCVEDQNRTRVTLAFSDSSTPLERAVITVKFPSTANSIQYSPCLTTNTVEEYDFRAFDQNDIYLPLANGLVGIGGNRWVIKETDSIHVCGKLSRKEPFVTFEDQTTPANQETRWRFTVFKGTSAQAVHLAERLNVWPVVGFEVPPYSPTPIPTATPYRSPTPSPTPTPSFRVTWEIDAGWSNRTLTVHVRLRNPGDPTMPLNFYALMEAGGSFYALPGFQEGILPLAHGLVVPAGTDVEAKLLDAPIAIPVSPPLAVSVFAAMADSYTGAIMGAVSNDQVTVN